MLSVLESDSMKTPFAELYAEDKTQLYALVLDLHRLAGIQYLDLAPRNILVDRDGRFQLCDFGLAQLHECAGEDACEELVGLRADLGMNGEGAPRTGGAGEESEGKAGV